MTKSKTPKVAARQLPLDTGRQPERSSAGSPPIRFGRSSVRLIEGGAGEAAARAQGEALISIAKRLGLMDEEEPE